MTDVGSVKASFVIDDSQYNDASKRAVNTSKKVEGSFGSMTKSVFTAQLAYAAFAKVISFVTGTVKRSITEYAKQEKAEKMLSTALGFTSNELLKQASAMQKLAGVADDAVISGQAFLAQMGLTEKQIKELTPAVVDFAQAKLNGDVVGAFNLLSKTVGSSTNALSRYGVEIEGAAGSNERVSSAITALNQRFGGQAEAIRNTWLGTSEALNNSTGDLLEVFGKFAVVVGKDMKNSVITMIDSTTEFLNKKENMEIMANVVAGVSAGFKTISSIFLDIFSGAASAAWQAIQDIKNEFMELLGGIGLNTDAIATISAIIKGGLNLALYIGIKLITGQIKFWINWATVIKETAILIGNFFSAFVTGDWDKMKKQASEVKDAFIDIGRDIKDDFIDVVKKGQEEFNKLPDSAVKIKTSFSNNFKDMKSQILTTTSEITKTVQDKMGDMGSNVKNVWEATTENILSKIQYFLEITKQGFESIGQTMMMFLDNEVAAIEASNDAKIEKLEELNESEQEALQDGYDQKVADLQTALENDVITRAEYNSQIEALEAEKNLATSELQKQQDARMAKQKADNLKKENAAKKKQFEANKANQIAMLWIQFALGTVAAFAQGIAQLGPIAGAIAGAAMTALLLGTTIAQTIAINNQKFIPERALGGSLEGGKPYVTSERGRELFIPDRSGYMFPNSATETILENVNSRSGKNVNINMAGAFNGATISDKISLKEIVNSVIGELGKQLELKT